MTVAVPAALAAFLRGIERRAALLAELQGGDPVRGDAALAAAMRAFAGNAANVAVAEWPRRFWALLLAAPALRRPPEGGWSVPFAALARVGNGGRATLLLRLVAGLGDADAAAVLGVEVPTFRRALGQAVPVGADGAIDPAAWRELEAAVQQALRQLPTARLLKLAQYREAALSLPPASRPPLSPRSTSAPRTHVTRRWRRPLLWGVLVLCVLAFAATFIRPDARLPPEDPTARIRRAPLLDADAPAATFDTDTALVSHRDFDQLADNDAAVVVRDLGFYAWYAAERAANADAGTAGGDTGDTDAPH